MEKAVVFVSIHDCQGGIWKTIERLMSKDVGEIKLWGDNNDRPGLTVEIWHEEHLSHDLTERREKIEDIVKNEP